MFEVKICGVTTADDAVAACAAGADALGLNFYERSARCIGPAAARHIAAAIPEGVDRVGVFVNAEIPFVQACYDDFGLHFVQLHGDEPPEYLAQLKDLPVIKAFRLGAEGLTEVRSYLHRCRSLNCRPSMVLVDAFRPGEYGGTGLALDWPALAAWRSALEDVSLVLAGGLTPANVGEAIGIVRPSAVDTASGVESAPGIKDAAQMQSYIAAAKAAFAAVKP